MALPLFVLYYHVANCVVWHVDTKIEVAHQKTKLTVFELSPFESFRESIMVD